MNRYFQPVLNANGGSSSSKQPCDGQSTSSEKVLNDLEISDNDCYENVPSKSLKPKKKYG